MPRSDYVNGLIVILSFSLAALFGFAYAPSLDQLEPLDRVLVFGLALGLIAYGIGLPLTFVRFTVTPEGNRKTFGFGSGARFLVIGGLIILGLATSGCASTLAGASAIREAYCDGVSTGGRVALAQIATGQPVPVVRCDPETVKPSAAPAPVVVAAPPAERPAPVATLAEPIDPLV